MHGSGYIPYNVSPLCNIYGTLIFLEEVHILKHNPNLYYTTLGSFYSQLMYTHLPPHTITVHATTVQPEAVHFKNIHRTWRIDSTRFLWLLTMIIIVSLCFLRPPMRRSHQKKDHLKSNHSNEPYTRRSSISGCCRNSDNLKGVYEVGDCFTIFMPYGKNCGSHATTSKW